MADGQRMFLINGHVNIDGVQIVSVIESLDCKNHESISGNTASFHRSQRRQWSCGWQRSTERFADESVTGIRAESCF